MRNPKREESPEMQIAPMIDCVFLMLIYFMTTSSLEKSEADLPCPVGGAAATVDPLPAVDEQTLLIGTEGFVDWNGSVFELTGDEGRASLYARLMGFKQTCSRAGSTPSLRILPDDDVPHQILVWLLDRIAESGIEQLHFP